MNPKLYSYLQPSYLSRTAIEAEILFAMCLSKCGFWSESVKTLPEKSPCSKKIGAESAVLNFVFFVMLKNKIEQSAKTKLLLNHPTGRSFGNRRSRYKEPSKNKAEAYRVYVEDSFLPCDAGDACIFSKEETGLYYYGARYLDPKYSRWLSGDPALNDYMAGSSVGEDGIYNTVNFNVYHYGGNNPIKYTDPDGRNIAFSVDPKLADGNGHTSLYF